MSYTALYRKFRPTVFEDVKGQEHIVTTEAGGLLMPICSAEPVEPVRPQLPRSLRKRSIVSIRWMAVRVGTVRSADPLQQEPA